MSLRDLLSSWNTPDDVITHFEDEDFTVKSILHIDTDYIKSVIVKEGPRSEFIYNWKALKENSSNVKDLNIEGPTVKKLKLSNPDEFENVPLAMENINLSDAKVVSTFDNPVISQDVLIPQKSDLNTTKFYSVDMNVEYHLDSILKASSKGQCGLAYYEQNKYLDNSHRIKIASCIMENELAHKTTKTIDVNRFKFLANKIVLKFPLESVITWFDDSGSTNKGKLQVQYHSIKRMLRKSGAVHSPKSNKNPKTLIQENEDVSQYLLWLSNNNGPKQTVEEFWEKTYASRINDLLLNHTAIYDYYKSYPVLNSDSGYTLLEIDFDLMHANKSLHLYAEWPNLCAFVIDELRKKNNTNDFKKKLDAFSGLSEDEKAVFLFSHIHSLFPVITAVNKGKKSWRPSREEMRESFLLHVKSYDDIRVQIELRRKKLLKWEMSLQPMAVIIGPTIDNISQHYVVIDDHFYNVESTIKAIDITFKSFHSLQAEYPPECQQTWLFFQQAIYDIKTDNDKPLSDAKTIATHYQMLYPPSMPQSSEETREEGIDD